jgi:pSer/pThr/pTyr-binding forkhead associated (FHA) protein
VDDSEDTDLRRRIPAPSGLTFEDTIMRARFPSAAAEGAPAEDDGAEPLPPLAIYGFRLSGSDVVVVLDRPAFIGRRPSPPRIPSGAPPRLVRVHSPRGEVSATHLELRQLGSTVVVTDMRSTNGSIVVFPGSEARSLRGGESIVVTPGTLVDIGDGNVVEILPLQQLD